MNRESIPVLGSEPGAPLHALARAFDGPCAALSWALPLGVALWSLGGDASFRDDLGVVRDLGFARVGAEGVVSTLFTQWLAALPLGSRTLRASLLGVLALGLASRCFFDVVRSGLDRRGAATSHPILALLTSSLWALGPAVQSEATRVGGALPALALVALGVGLGRRAVERAEPAALAGTGLVLGAALAESRAAGACLAVALASLAAAEPGRVWWQAAWRFAGAGMGAFLLLASLRWGWPASAPALPPVAGLSVVSSSLDAPPNLGFVELVAQAAALAADELGGVTLGLALAGALLAVCTGRLRRAPAAWALPLALAVVGPACLGVPAAWTPTFTLLSNLGVVAFFPFGLQALVHWAWRSSLPLARPAAVLSLIFASTLVLSRVDRATLVQPQRAAAVWAEEALGRLPPDSVLVVQSPALVFRLLASRTLHGTRPDVLVVPAALLTQSSFGRDLPRSSPSAAPLLRQLWINGAADEYSLSHLADERPVFVELDPNWDTRLLEHLRPDGLWLGYSASELAASDRRDTPTRSRAALRRVLEGVGVQEPSEPGGAAAPCCAASLDRATRQALGDALGRQALLLGALAEFGSARRLLRAASRIDPGNALAAGLAARLAEPAPGRVAARDLLE